MHQRKKLKNQSREQLETQRMTILEEIKRTASELNELRKDKKASLSALQALQAKLNARQLLINNINNEISIIEENIHLANKDVLVLKTQLDTLKRQYAEMVRYTYKNRTSSDMIVFFILLAIF
jgi:predicted nuclease with TOPRIM domain